MQPRRLRRRRRSRTVCGSCCCATTTTTTTLSNTDFMLQLRQQQQQQQRRRRGGRWLATPPPPFVVILLVSLVLMNTGNNRVNAQSSSALLLPLGRQWDYREISNNDNSDDPVPVIKATAYDANTDTMYLMGTAGTGRVNDDDTGLYQDCFLGRIQLPTSSSSSSSGSSNNAVLTWHSTIVPEAGRTSCDHVVAIPPRMNDNNNNQEESQSSLWAVGTLWNTNRTSPLVPSLDEELSLQSTLDDNKASFGFLAPFVWQPSKPDDGENNDNGGEVVGGSDPGGLDGGLAPPPPPPPPPSNATATFVPTTQPTAAPLLPLPAAPSSNTTTFLTTLSVSPEITVQFRGDTAVKNHVEIRVQHRGPPSTVVVTWMAIGSSPHNRMEGSVACMGGRHNSAATATADKDPNDVQLYDLTAKTVAGIVPSQIQSLAHGLFSHVSVEENGVVSQGSDLVCTVPLDLGEGLFHFSSTDETPIIVAWGSDVFGYHGPDQRFNNLRVPPLNPTFASLPPARRTLVATGKSVLNMQEDTFDEKGRYDGDFVTVWQDGGTVVGDVVYRLGDNGNATLLQPMAVEYVFDENSNKDLMLVASIYDVRGASPTLSVRGYTRTNSNSSSTLQLEHEWKAANVVTSLVGFRVVGGRWFVVGAEPNGRGVFGTALVGGGNVFEDSAPWSTFDVGLIQGLCVSPLSIYDDTVYITGGSLSAPGATFVQKIGIVPFRPSIWSVSLDFAPDSGVHGKACALPANEPGVLYVAGNVQGQILNSTNSPAGDSDIFIAKLNSTDGTVLWTRQFGSTEDDWLAERDGLVVTENSGVILVGNTKGSLFRYHDGGGQTETFVARVTPSGDLPITCVYSNCTQTPAPTVAPTHTSTILAPTIMNISSSSAPTTSPINSTWTPTVAPTAVNASTVAPTLPSLFNATTEEPTSATRNVTTSMPTLGPSASPTRPPLTFSYALSMRLNSADKLSVESKIAFERALEKYYRRAYATAANGTNSTRQRQRELQGLNKIGNLDTTVKITGESPDSTGNTLSYNQTIVVVPEDGDNELTESNALLIITETLATEAQKEDFLVLLLETDDAFASVTSIGSPQITDEYRGGSNDDSDDDSGGTDAMNFVYIGAGILVCCCISGVLFYTRRRNNYKEDDFDPENDPDRRRTDALSVEDGNFNFGGGTLYDNEPEHDQREGPSSFEGDSPGIFDDGIKFSSPTAGFGGGFDQPERDRKNLSSADEFGLGDLNGSRHAADDPDAARDDTEISSLLGGGESSDDSVSEFGDDSSNSSGLDSDTDAHTEDAGSLPEFGEDLEPGSRSGSSNGGSFAGDEDGNSNDSFCDEGSGNEHFSDGGSGNDHFNNAGGGEEGVSGYRC